MPRRQSRGEEKAYRRPREASVLGMRGGLGRTLLLAFLLLTIVPLSLLAFLTYNQIQRDTRQRLLISLETITALKEAHLRDWVEGTQRELSLMAGSLGDQGDSETLVGSRGGQSAKGEDGNGGLLWTGVPVSALTEHPALAALALVDGRSGDVLSTANLSEPGLGELRSRLDVSRLKDSKLVIMPVLAKSQEMLPVIGTAWDDKLLLGLLRWDSLRDVVMAPPGQPGGFTFPALARMTGERLEEGAETYLVTPDSLVVSDQAMTELSRDGQEVTSAGVLALLDGQNGTGEYEDLAGVPVLGAYRWVPDLGVGILVEQSEAESLATGDALTALVVGATLAVALITAAIAAVVTRRITRPIVQLTETAAWMARGDLNQEVPISRKDEIGVLARAFNRMAADLRILYASLEAKVAERTQQLEEANEYTRYYIMQLAMSAEVARVVSSIRDLDLLLNTVVELIGRSFELHRVSIFLLEEGVDSRLRGEKGENTKWENGSQAALPVRRALLRAVWQAENNDLPALGDEATGTDLALISQVVAKANPCVIRSGQAGAAGAKTGWEETLTPPVRCKIVMPLHVRDKILGVLDVQSTRPDDLAESDQVVYRSLADQIGIAIENARAYGVEREAANRLRELDRIQARFLTNMSHALRTPLNSIIGFSRVMLKGLDGPLTDLQQADLATVYASGRQLLGLINDMFELSQLDMGVAPFSVAEVDLGEIIEGVLVTTQALARDKQIQVQEDVADDLPLVYTDGQRVRQVILALLSNAVKFTREGTIRLVASADDGVVTISVSDTGVGIPRRQRQVIFADVRSREVELSRDPPGFGLAISKRVIEKLGGQIWCESEEGVGSIFTFTLPVCLGQGEAMAGLSSD